MCDHGWLKEKDNMNDGDVFLGKNQREKVIGTENN